MDRIEQLMKNAKPHLAEPGTSTSPGALPDRSEVFSTDSNLVYLTKHRPRWARVRATAGVVLAAASVIGAVVLAGNLVPRSAPAVTGTHSVSATPTPAPTPTATVSASANDSCSVANIDQQRHDQVRAIEPIPDEHHQYYRVLGCGEGWIAYSISDEGVRARGVDGGNAWFNLARLQDNHRFLTDFAQGWASVYSWEFQSFAVQNGEFATAQQAMDQEFANKGIPVRLRPQLVGAGPAAPTGVTAPQP